MSKDIRVVRLSNKTMELIDLYCKSGTENDINEMNCKKISNVNKSIHDAVMYCLNYKIKNRVSSVDEIIKAEKEDKDAKTN